jgi:hypothetical protein
MSGNKRPKDATTRIVLVCNQRPLCKCPTTSGKAEVKCPVWVRRRDTILQLKEACQAQLSRGSETNGRMLDPGRQVLYDPSEGHELQDHMPHGFADGTEVRLTLRRIDVPMIGPPYPWVAAFVRAKCLTHGEITPVPDRPIRDVQLEISLFETGGKPELASSFAARDTMRLGGWAESEIAGLGVPDSEWRRVDGNPGHALVTSTRTAPAAAGQLARSFRAPGR